MITKYSPSDFHTSSSPKPESCDLRRGFFFGAEMLTRERVRELFDYLDGKLVRRFRVRNCRAGDVAGHIRKDGYVRIGIDGEHYLLHRVIWAWHHGYFPENQIDHINKNHTDNRITNLREVTQTCNMRNRGNYHNNTSGVKGVHWRIKHNKWDAVITIGGLFIMIGRHNSFIEAVCHRLAAEQALDWAGCDSSSPAFQYVKKHIPHIK